jgi:hypothetical protein
VLLAAWKPISCTTPRALLLVIGAGLLACSDATEAVNQSFVTIASASPVVLRGDQIELTAKLWNRTSPSDSVEVRNAELVWSSDDPTLATLSGKDNNTAVATGVNSGIVQIRAVATGFQGAAPAAFQLRVANPLEIDSMRPSVVRYGEKVTMYGVGVNTLFLSAMPGATLVPDTFSTTVGTGGVGHMSFWVPPPAQSGHAVVLSPTQIVVASDSTTVLPRDLYEPNDTTPSVIDLSVGPFPSLPTVAFYNPALAFENRLRADSLGVDWYRFSGVTPGSDLTFIFMAPTLKSAHLTFLASAIGSKDSVATPGWTIGSGLYACKNHSWKVDERPADSLVIALKQVPAGPIDLASLFVVTGRYGMAVVRGYLTTDPTIGPDRLEENDNCEFADSNFAHPATRVDLGVKAFSDSLTIDNPHDIDWIRFRVSGSLAQTVTFKTSAPAVLDPSSRNGDVDLYVMGVPVAGQPLDTLGSSKGAGSNESLTLLLSPGDYYMVVTDFAGSPTRYSLCAAVGLSCTPPVGFSISSAAPSMSRARRRSGAVR